MSILHWATFVASTCYFNNDLSAKLSKHWLGDNPIQNCLKHSLAPNHCRKLRAKKMQKKPFRFSITDTILSTFGPEICKKCLQFFFRLEKKSNFNWLKPKDWRPAKPLTFARLWRNSQKVICSKKKRAVSSLQLFFSTTFCFSSTVAKMTFL